VFLFSLLCTTTVTGQPFNFLGGGGGEQGDLEKKFLQALVATKKLYATQMELKNSCTTVRKKNKAISSFSELYKIPAKLWPFFPCSLLNCGFGDAAKLLLRISNVLQSTYQKVRSFSGSLWLRKSDFLFFLPVSFRSKKQNGWPSIKYTLWLSFGTRMTSYSLLNFKALQLHIRTITVNANTFLQKLGLTLFEDKKSCREMRREKISCPAGF